MSILCKSHMLFAFISIILLLSIFESHSLNGTTFFASEKYNEDVFINLPQVFLLGAQKAGTESMFEILIQHDKLCGSNGEGAGNWKESHFFTGKYFASDSKTTKDALDTYQKGYNDEKCMNGKGRFIDGTPTLSHCISLGHIHSFYPREVRSKMKFIAILREPISRDWSGFKFGLTHFLHFDGKKNVPILPLTAKDVWSRRSNNDTKHGFDVFKEKECGEIRGINEDFKQVFRGNYLAQFKNYLKYFKRSQLLILNVQNLFSDPNQAMITVQDFLNLKKPWPLLESFPHDSHPANFDADVPVLRCVDRDYMAAKYEPLNQALYKWVNSDVDGKRPQVEPKFVEFTSYREIPCVK